MKNPKPIANRVFYVGHHGIPLPKWPLYYISIETQARVTLAAITN